MQKNFQNCHFLGWKIAKNGHFWLLKFRNFKDFNSGIDIGSQFRNSGIRDRYCKHYWVLVFWNFSSQNFIGIEYSHFQGSNTQYLIVNYIRNIHRVLYMEYFWYVHMYQFQFFRENEVFLRKCLYLKHQNISKHCSICNKKCNLTIFFVKLCRNFTIFTGNGMYKYLVFNT